MSRERGTRKLPNAALRGPVSHALFRVVRLHRMLAGHLLRDLGLHRGQELLLMHLWDSGPVRQTELIAVLDSDSATITRMVQRLEKAGLVERAPDPADGRATLVSSTSAGDAMRAAIERMWHDLEASTVGDLPSTTLNPLMDALAAVEVNLSAAVAKPDRA
ncbi:MarR family winged helix-turn-helix transcriptional regulator [Umezawaea endophytica]|uniref:MarR family winged helix-turn-helix transcriptional regulator n=1 Tax=Umezawaea endophytica TaxID=1654476 RepID=A0A9X2VHP8_9PSEU|nr:MarR family winged helix-turn-helix transcriptional regulator [Umezawaea endophytica]MCS7476945.1 MarR family winged helix-turn-helix transcriptional regulator [Umezawaea endophytica]